MNKGSILKNKILDPPTKYKCLEDDDLDPVFILSDSKTTSDSPNAKKGPLNTILNMFAILILVSIVGFIFLMSVNVKNSMNDTITEGKSIIEKLRKIIDTLKNNEGPSRCHMKVDQGPCRAFKKMYYFDASKGTCSEFFYGGCEGNDNRFDRMDTCLSTCSEEKKKPSINICNLEPTAGPCRALIPRYYFDSKKRICTEFSYGGCQGNANNFKTKKDCEKTCEHTNPGIIQVEPPFH